MRIFFGALGAALSASLFALFGAIAAFGVLAFSGKAPEAPQASSPELSEFLLSSEKSREFNLKAFEEGVFFMLLDCARGQKNGARAVPTPPSFRIKKGALEIGIPFSATAFSSSAKLGAYVSLSRGADGKICAASARIGDARLPKFAAEILAKKLLSMYAPLNSPAFAALEKAKISPVGDIKIFIEK